jgi:hypothetical protein|tara:strand:- start:1708 stop:2373 length:666 start_codon:yes stop_codon:yes gene_type:complete
MSFTYAQLKQAIQDYTENDETSFVTNLPLFIRQAEERILKNVQLSLFRKNSTASTTADNPYLAMPSDYLAPFSLSLRGPDADRFFVDFKDPSFLQTYTPDDTTTGAPRYYGVFDVENFLLAPTPNAPSVGTNYTAELHYFYRPQSLTAGADGGTTWLSINAELALLYGALIEAYIYMKGDQDVMSMYTSRFQEALIGIKMLGEAKETTDEYRTGKVIRAKQ